MVEYIFYNLKNIKFSGFERKPNWGKELFPLAFI